MKIVTVTLNPALDKTASLDELLPGELNRLRDVMVDAGGKGVNVSRMIASLGGSSTATGFVGGGTGDEIVRALDAQGIPHDFVRIAGATRTNLKVLDRGTRLTELNEPGAVIDESEWAALRDKVRALAGPDVLFAFSGSVPRGGNAEIYADLIRMVHAEGAAAFLDADGAPFRAALACGPDLIKPNRHELLEFFGRTGPADLPELAKLCGSLLEQGVGGVVLSMGSEGAMFVSGGEALYAPGLAVEAHSSVGAGDSMVGAMAYAAAREMSWRDSAALAMAASAGAVTTRGTKPPDRSLVDELLARVELRPI